MPSPPFLEHAVQELVSLHFPHSPQTKLADNREHAVQELMSLREHVLMAINTGVAQADAAASELNWERLQAAVATMIDKAMYVLVIARTSLCERGGYSSLITLTVTAVPQNWQCMIQTGYMISVGH